MSFNVLSLALASAFAFIFPLATGLNKRTPDGVPSYVTQYAPVVYLASTDKYFPSDIGAQLANTHPDLNSSAIVGAPSPLTLDNLNQLNSLGAKDVYLTSNEDITTNPSYLYGVAPDASGRTGNAVSCAVIVNDHGNGAVDAFYMYFYAFDFGGVYVGLNVGNHVGDWEHNMVRFQDGLPTAVWYSQHSNGEAFTYDVLNKYDGGDRPIVFSANGSHANYAIDGDHAYGIPDINLSEGLIEDHTDQGRFWDPTLSAYYYQYDASSTSFGTYDDSTPVGWLSFVGHWGDDRYPDSDHRQECLLDIDALCKYTTGPTGPEDKHLNRTEVCPDNGELCIVRSKLGP